MKKRFTLFLALTLMVIGQAFSQQMVEGSKIDTGKKWTDGSIIYKKLVSFGALPVTTTKNVAHGVTPALTKYARVSAFIARNGTQYLNIPAVSLTAITITATNISITSTADLSAYTAWVEIEFCE